MNFFNIFFFVFLALAMLVGAEAKVPFKAIKKGGKIIVSTELPITFAT